MKKINTFKGLVNAAFALKRTTGQPIDEVLQIMLSSELFREHLTRILGKETASELVADMNFCGQVAILMQEELERRKVETKC